MRALIYLYHINADDYPRECPKTLGSDIFEFLICACVMAWAAALLWW